MSLPTARAFRPSRGRRDRRQLLAAKPQDGLDRIRILLPARLRRDGEAAGRAIAEQIAVTLAERGAGTGRSHLSVSLPGDGRSAAALARESARALGGDILGGRSWR